LDLYQPTDIGGGALPALSPGIVLLHGGFGGGDKADQRWVDRTQSFAMYGQGLLRSGTVSVEATGRVCRACLVLGALGKLPRGA